MFKVVLGGTFEFMHDGHVRLLDEAFRLLKENESCVSIVKGIVHIGLTSDKMAGSKSHYVSAYENRKKMLEIEIKKIIEKYGLNEENYMITKLEDPLGSAIVEDYDYIVVSPETKTGALKINEIRREKNLKEIKIKVVPFVLADDEKPISSTRIYNGEIDRKGKIKRKYELKVIAK
ncbi:MAG: phosphopantetheine adenylyltransferase [Methanosarcinaceae archaeon]|nr:phosphopantetheine adenylyltransferase [Methanosarcinaceae archaeon]